MAPLAITLAGPHCDLKCHALLLAAGLPSAV